VLRVALTGGIACGKSRVLRRLAAAGFDVLDLDAVAREVTAPGGAAYEEVVRAFGPGILAKDGAVDRKALAAIVFADASARARLNAIVHPRIREEEARRLAERAGEPEAVSVTDAALLVETGQHLRFDRLVVVHCAPAEQLRRLMARDGIDEGAARARIAAQMPVEEKRRFAHLEVDATGTLEETDRAADAVAAELLRLARAPRSRPQVALSRRLGCLVSGPAAGPRGLDPRRLVVDIAAAGGLEMERVARLLVPPASGPWYRAALDPPPLGPETLAAPIVLWALARCRDDELVGGAAFSLARLTHVADVEVAGAVLFALVLTAVVAGEPLAPDLLAKRPGWTRLARRWAGAEPPRRIAAAVEAAVAGVAATGELSGALRGAAIGVPADAAPPDVLRAVEAIERRSGT
jgi:dephospho-CoA kinase